ncbi:MAG TPA: right-handed parallel beta-helix repeat-containing protein [Candidatus Borkfalkia avistercoris]|uniref:Right-handed parallel beta-helix repeat-containing protein n=1 Tax=Candidatus Borkfalkia avistercoris TaxID=2838504 RepID=A0A9D2CYP0_9FIRM|nr:right-handed parallel beta-helix repeat-containing protein [Candidatus Borkfalkia avistercoris]
MKSKSLTKALLCALVFLIVAAIGIQTVFLFRKDPNGGQNGVSIDKLISTAYALDMDNTTTLTDPGLSNPWIVGVDGEAYESNESKYAPDESAAKIIKAADHGVNGTDKLDDTLALEKALDAVRDAAKDGSSVILELPEGDLDFIEGMSPEHPDYAIVIDGIDNLTVRGSNTNLYFHGTFKPFHITDCKNFRATGFNIDWGRVPFSMGKIVETDGRTFKIKVDEGYPVDDSTEIMGMLEYNARTNAPLSNGNDIYYNVEYVRYLGEQTLEIRFTNAYKASPAGTIVILRHQIYSYDAFTVQRCENAYFEHVNVYSAPGMAFMGQENENLYFNDFNVMLKPGTDRLMSVTADGIHLMETAGEVVVTNSLFENCGDDALNVHGFYSTLKEITNGRKTIHIVNERDYNFSPAAGDTLAVVNRETLTEKCTLTVESVAKSKTDNGFDVTFAEALPEGVETGDMVVNKSHAAEVTFSNNIVRNKRCRGILIQSAAGGVVEHNLFYNLTDAGILLTSDTSEWYEAMPTSDLIIRNNKFISTNLSGGARAAITAYCYGPDGAEGEAGIMKNISAENNLIANSGCAGVMYCGVSDSSFTHNIISNVGLVQNKVGVIMRKVKAISITKNEVLAASTDFNPGIAEDCEDNVITVTDNEGLSQEDFVVSADVTTTDVAKIASGSISADGDLSDWADKGTEIAMVGASNNEQEQVVLDDSDIKINSVKFAWDDNGIYISYDVFDDRLSWVTGSYWNGDGVEIFMTQNTDSSKNLSGLKLEDPTCMQLFMGDDLCGGCQVVAARTSDAIMSSKDQIKMSFRVKDDNKGYCGEVFIPFSVVPDIKTKVEAGEAISLAIRFADSDADGASLIQISNVDAPVELNKYIPKRMPKIKFVAGGEQA